MQNKWKKRCSLFYHSWLFSLFVALLIAASFKSAVADWNIVPTCSMKPTILEGDRIFVNKLAYDLKVPFTTIHLAEWDDPRRGDIVVFFSPADGRRLVKRVIGIPGDSLAMRNNRLFINGEPLTYGSLDQDFIDGIAAEERPFHLFYSENIAGRSHPVMVTPSRPFFRSFDPLTVPEGKYFMMGDNRDNSGDSRFFGFVDRNSIVGKTTAVVVSLNRDHYYFPRWSRSFQRLP